MIEDNLISTLEQSLRQFKPAEIRLLDRLSVVERHIEKLKNEADELRNEIKALQNSAEKTEQALESLRSYTAG